MDWIVLAMAGFLGGLLNAIAGGGSFITLPALIFVGVPPVAANATGTAALLPGYIASAWRFRKDVELPANLSFGKITLVAIVGGSLGAITLMMSSETLFSSLIPWLILFATIAFIIGPRLVQKNTSTAQDTKVVFKPTHQQVLKSAFIILCVCIYGGYFNGGLGIIILATLGLMGQTNLHGMNGLKNVLSAILTAVAVCVYAAGDTLSFKYLLIMGIFAIIGGYTGAVIAYRISQTYLRYFIVVVGLFMATVFFFRNA